MKKKKKMKIEKSWYKELKQESPGNKFWTRGTKVNVGIALIVVSILLGTSIGFSVRTITNTGDNVDTFIRNSKGNYWTATGANLQLAFDDLGNLSGWVDGGGQNIYITSTIKLGRYAEFRNFNLCLATNANCTMLKNYTGTGKSNIYIHDGYLNGNGLNQPEWNRTGQWTRYAHGIFFIGTDNLRIEHVIINNTAMAGIIIQKSDNISISDNQLRNIAKLYKNSGTYKPTVAEAMFIYNCSNTLVTDNIVFNAYACGIVIEGEMSAPMLWREYNVIVSSNTVTDTCFGFYYEDVRDVSSTGNNAFECDDTTVYGSPLAAGYRVAPACTRITFSNDQAYSCYRGWSIGSATNISLIGCRTSFSHNNGIYNCARFSRLVGCTFDQDVNIGVLLANYNQTMDGCSIYRSGGIGVQVQPSESGGTDKKNGYTIISDCDFYKTVSTAIFTYASNTSIKDNTIVTCGYGIEISSCNNCTIADNSLLKMAGRPIRLSTSTRSTVFNNFISGGSSGGNGIQLISCKNVTVSFNTVQGSGGDYPTTGIIETTRGDHNWIIFNKCIDVTTDVTTVGATTKTNASALPDWNWDI